MDAGSAVVKDEVKATEPEKPPAAAMPESSPETKKPAPVEVEDVPDPDEDDLDDLDDLLDDFSASKVEPKEPAVKSTTSSAAPSTEPPPATADLDDDEFAKQLQAGMAELLGEIDKSPEMLSHFEAIFKNIEEAAATVEAEETAGKVEAASKGGTSSKAGSTTSAPDASFQDTIRETMKRVQNSGDQATAAAAAGDGTDDLLSELLKHVGSGGLDGNGNEEDFSKMLMGMMEQLTNKEILYDPMKELHEKFPDWLEKNKGKTSEEDLKKYKEQQQIVAEIVAKFEESTYTDSSTTHREYIVERMQKMQATGSPPADLVGDMPSAQEAFNPDENCAPQ